MPDIYSSTDPRRISQKKTALLFKRNRIERVYWSTYMRVNGIVPPWSQTAKAFDLQLLLAPDTPDTLVIHALSLA